VGTLKGRWLKNEHKDEILRLIEWGKSCGTNMKRSCEMWGISRRRVVRWQKRQKEGKSLENGKPGPREPVHRLLPEERETILMMAKQEEHVDLSHRILTVTAWEQEIFYTSFSSVYRVLRDAGLTTMRGVHRPHNGRCLAPDRRELTGPNQRWCWDISYLRTMEKWVFLYLYLLLDEYSRKAIQWHVSWSLSAKEARCLLEGGLIAENILDLPEEARPEVINDRGRQMKAKSIRTMFRDHKMPQLFARPRTPNDNPFVESAFGTVKTAPGYPGRFLDYEEAVHYFDNFFVWYNMEHYHSGIEYVTPEQCHEGLRESIVANRKQKQLLWRQMRKEVNLERRTKVDRTVRRWENNLNSVGSLECNSFLN